MEENPSRISYLPTEGLTYDPSDSKYWNENELQKEIEDRSFVNSFGVNFFISERDLSI